MSNQTPPKATEEQLARIIEIVENIIREHELSEGDLEYILGCKSLGIALDQTFKNLAAEYRQCLPLLERPVWKTIQLGTHADEQAMIKNMEAESRFMIDAWAKHMLLQTDIGTQPEEAKLYLLSGEDLGFSVPATLKQHYDKAIALGFELCPAEVGPQLRLQHHLSDQRQKEVLHVAMYPIRISGGCMKLYTVDREYDELWLCSKDVTWQDVFRPSDRWVFRRK